MGKGTDNKIRKNLIISCLVELIAEQLRGNNVETQKNSVKAQLEEHLSAKLVVKIIQDLHERLGQNAKAEFAVNLLADVQLLRNGKIPPSTAKSDVLPKAIAAISAPFTVAAQGEASSSGTNAPAKSSNATEQLPEAQPQQPEAQQPQEPQQPQTQAQPSPTNQSPDTSATSTADPPKKDTAAGPAASTEDKKRKVIPNPEESATGTGSDAKAPVNEDSSESATKKPKLEARV